MEKHGKLGDLFLFGEIPDSVSYKVDQENRLKRRVFRRYHGQGFLRQNMHPLIKTVVHLCLSISNFLVQAETCQIFGDFGDSHSL